MKQVRKHPFCQLPLANLSHSTQGEKRGVDGSAETVLGLPKLRRVQADQHKLKSLPTVPAGPWRISLRPLGIILITGNYQPAVCYASGHAHFPCGHGKPVESSTSAGGLSHTPFLPLELIISSRPPRCRITHQIKLMAERNLIDLRCKVFLYRTLGTGCGRPVGMSNTGVVNAWFRLRGEDVEMNEQGS